MKNITLILISLMFLTGCEKEVSDLQDRGGVKYEVNSETPFTGKVSLNHKNGQKAYKGSFKDGKHEGVHTEWHENGQKKSEITYKDGKWDGIWTHWHENGQKEAERTFKNGKLDGLLTEWHENGQKKSEDNYKNGVLLYKK